MQVNPSVSYLPVAFADSVNLFPTFVAIAACNYYLYAITTNVLYKFSVGNGRVVSQQSVYTTLGVTSSRVTLTSVSCSTVGGSVVVGGTYLISTSSSSGTQGVLVDYSIISGQVKNKTLIGTNMYVTGVTQDVKGTSYFAGYQLISGYYKKAFVGSLPFTAVTTFGGGLYDLPSSIGVSSDSSMLVVSGSSQGYGFVQSMSNPYQIIGGNDNNSDSSNSSSAASSVVIPVLFLMAVCLYMFCKDRVQRMKAGMSPPQI